jgi:hypothetical protein
MDAVTLYRGVPQVALGVGIFWLLASCGRSYADPTEDQEVAGKPGMAAGAGGGAGRTGGRSGGRGGTLPAGSAGLGPGSSGARAVGGGDGGADAGGEGGSGGEAGTTGSGGVGAAGVGGVGASAGEAGESSSGCNPVGQWSANLERCEGSFVHRAKAAACALPPRDETFTDLPADAGTEPDLATVCEGPPSFDSCYIHTDDCTRDADCGARAYCVRRVELMWSDYYIVDHDCVAACATDADCGGGEICACDYRMQNATREAISLGVCTPATCTIDADCADGNLCIAPLNEADLWDNEIRAFSEFHCQRERDECRGTDDCPFAGCDVNDCVHAGDRFICEPSDFCDY